MSKGQKTMAKSNRNIIAANSFIRSLFANKQAGRKVVFVSGFFRILHPGHLRLLRLAKELGHFLVVGVCRCNQDDEQIDDNIRLKLIESIDWVDHAFLIDEAAVEEVILQIQPAIVVKGKEHELKENPEQRAVDSYGGKLIFSSGETSLSSAELAQDSINQRSTIAKPKDFPQRHGFDMGDLANIVARFSELKVCVIGDTIVDEYINCEPLGMSQEDPTVVVRPTNSEKFIGGAAIVAAHIKSLGAGEVSLYSVLGNDDSAEFAKKLCERCGLDTHFISDESRPTTLKQRYRARNKTLLRVNHLRQHHISKKLQSDIFASMTEAMNGAKLLIFSDFSYGMLPQNLVERISQYCKEHEIMMVADSQCSSQTGDISRFKDTTFVSPTEFEARISLKNSDDGLVVLAEKLRQKAKAEHVFVTLGEDGVLIQTGDKGLDGSGTDRLPAFNNAAKDNAGAGDCFMAMTAMATATGASIWESAYLGSIAAACQVSRIGNMPLSAQTVLMELVS